MSNGSRKPQNQRQQKRPAGQSTISSRASSKAKTAHTDAAIDSPSRSPLLLWCTLGAVVLILCVSAFYVENASAEEATPPAEVEEVTEMHEDPSLSARIKNAIKYATSGDSRAIVTEAGSDLTARLTEIEADEARIAETKAEIEAVREELQQMREQLVDRGEKVTKIQTKLTQCIVNATQGVQDAEEGE